MSTWKDTEKNRVYYGFTVPRKLWQRLNEEKEKEGFSTMADFIRYILRRFLEEKER